jgi:phenylpyruvate tautomerase PptA (4-oxalocrotonate tautomerase family)
MDMTDRTSRESESPASAGGLNRRAMLVTAAVAAGAAAGIAPAMADTVPAGNFGAPLVELHFPAGILSLEQKAAMIKGVTEVVLKAAALPPNPPRYSFVQLFETAEGGFGVNGQVFVPRGK